MITEKIKAIDKPVRITEDNISSIKTKGFYKGGVTVGDLVFYIFLQDTDNPNSFSMVALLNREIGQFLSEYVLMKEAFYSHSVYVKKR